MSGLEGLLAGRVLGGRYLIEEVIGRGGMGAVYRAVDERLGRPVAVKVITVAGAAEPEARERLRARFHREARAAAALPHHPNVVPVYDYGTDEALGLDFLVMELLRGHDLATRLARSGPPPLPAALKVLHQAARGLAVGHRAGLIHRDVKPGNIFLAQADHNEVQVRVVDFGIAKLVTDEDTFNQLTQDGRAPHSPAYASPEQLRGLSGLSPASDVFSLGAVGYQLLSGERPFSESDRNRMSLGMPVEVPPLRSRNPAVPAAVEAVIHQALAFDPEDRFPDAGALAAALDQAIRALPDSAVEPYAPAIADPSLPGAGPGAPADDDRTHFFDEDDHTLLAPPPPPVGGPAAPGETVRPAAAAPASGAARAAAARKPAEEPKRRRWLAPTVWTLVLLALAAVAVWAWMAGGSGFRTVAPVDEEPDTLAVAPVDSQVLDTAGVPDALDAVVLNQEGLRYYREGQYQAAMASFQQAVEIAPENVAYRRNLALALLRAGDPRGAAQQLQRVVEMDPAQEVAYANLAEAQLAQGDTSAAIRSLESFLERSQDPRLRSIVERQLRNIQAARAGLLGVPLDTGTQIPDTLRRDSATLRDDPGA